MPGREEGGFPETQDLRELRNSPVSLSLALKAPGRAAWCGLPSPGKVGTRGQFCVTQGDTRASLSLRGRAAFCPICSCRPHPCTPWEMI